MDKKKYGLFFGMILGPSNRIWMIIILNPSFQYFRLIAICVLWVEPFSEVNSRYHYESKCQIPCLKMIWTINLSFFLNTNSVWINLPPIQSLINIANLKTIQTINFANLVWFNLWPILLQEVVELWCNASHSPFTFWAFHCLFPASWFIWIWLNAGMRDKIFD